ncbi:MAG: hypothetical protein WCJ04_07385 [Actinomycetes bacterium]
MRLNRVGFGALIWSLGTAALLFGVSNASAESSVSVTPDSISVTAEQSVALVQVRWSGLESRQLVFVDICKKSISDSSFTVAEDCGAYSGLTPNGSAAGDGSAELEVFRGQDPAGEAWGCYAEADTAPVGVTKYTICFVRVTDTVVLNVDNDSETPIRFEGSGRVDPGTSATTSAGPPPPQLPSSGSSSGASAGTSTVDDAEALQFAGSDSGAGVAITG